MTELAYLPIEKGDIPYKFSMQINNTTYTFTIRYNTEGDFYTLTVQQGSEIIAYNIKLVYGNDIFESIPQEMAWGVIPFDFSNNSTECNQENFMEDVKPYIVAGD